MLGGYVEKITIDGYEVLISPQDYERVTAQKWYSNRHKASHIYFKQGTTKNGKFIGFYLHRFILNAPEGTQVDHRDGNTLNNTRENLRLCTHSQNMQNRRKLSHKKFKGTWYEKGIKKWRARIQLSNGMVKNLGCFTTEEEAHAAYVAAAKKYHGEFAHA